MSDFFENPAVRHRFGTAGLDWSVFLTEDDEELAEEISEATVESVVESD